MLPRGWVRPRGRERGPQMENHGPGGEGCRRGACLGQEKATTRYTARSLWGRGNKDSPQGVGSSASPKREPAPTATGRRSPPAPARPFPGAKGDQKGEGEAGGEPSAEQEPPGGTRSCARTGHLARQASSSQSEAQKRPLPFSARPWGGGPGRPSAASAPRGAVAGPGGKISEGTNTVETSASPLLTLGGLFWEAFFFFTL